MDDAHLGLELALHDEQPRGEHCLALVFWTLVHTMKFVTPDSSSNEMKTTPDAVSGR